jgi:hypothetical protein
MKRILKKAVPARQVYRTDVRYTEALAFCLTNPLSFRFGNYSFTFLVEKY